MCCSSCGELREVFHAPAVVRYGGLLTSPPAAFPVQDLGEGSARKHGQKMIKGSEPEGRLRARQPQYVDKHGELNEGCFDARDAPKLWRS